MYITNGGIFLLLISIDKWTYYSLIFIMNVQSEKKLTDQNLFPSLMDN